MSKYLILIESPGKQKTIQGFLGPDYKVMASYGHIRLLEKTGKHNLGIDVDDKFQTHYKNDPSKKEHIKKLKAAVKSAEIVYLASDNDREGEAIAQSLKEALKIPKSKYKRIVFNEITKKAINDAIANPKDIDSLMVDSQEARRILDRIIGFRLSNFTMKKAGAKSAGRVQSSALKILVDREREINAFIPATYYEIYLPFIKNDKEYIAKYKGTDKKKIVSIKKLEDVNKILSELKDDKYIVGDIVSKDKKIPPKPPYTTSSFQQEVSAKLNYSSKRAMSIAQSLYEGKNINGTHYGLITYMRTDSIKLSDDFVEEAKNHITKTYGKKYYNGVRPFKNKASAQEAHEGIRPTHLEFTPESLANVLEADELKVYTLIYNRALASLMVDSQVKDTEVFIYNGVHKFGITGREVIFDGFTKLYEEFVEEDKEESKILPSFKLKESIKAKNVKVEKKETTPPGRFTEASLVKKMEESGIGRPSTYASTMDTLRDRLYIENNNKSLVPTEMGIKVISLLEKHFFELVGTTYTAQMEATLDNIANGSANKLKELRKFYESFEAQLSVAMKEAEVVKEAPVESDKFCSKCGAVMFIRKSKYGEFYACSRFPQCKNTESKPKDLPDEVNVELPKIGKHTCPACGVGTIIPKVTRKGKNVGKIFYACNQYPACKTTYTQAGFTDTFIKKSYNKKVFIDLSSDSD